MSVGWIFMKTVSGWQRVNVGILAHQIWREYFDIMLSWSLEQNVLLVHHGRVVDSSPALLILRPHCWFFTRIVDSSPALLIRCPQCGLFDCMNIMVHIMLYDSAFFQHMILVFWGFFPLINRYIFDISIDICREPCRHSTSTFADIWIDICAPPYSSGTIRSWLVMLLSLLAYYIAFEANICEHCIFFNDFRLFIFSFLMSTHL